MVLVPPVEPMLARAVSGLPGPGALPGGTVFEPKYDGYRLIVFADAEGVFLQSRNGRDLTAFFPEIADAAAALGEDVVIDGEVVIHTGGRLDFSALQQRINRRPRTVARFARDTPAHLIAFDLLQHAGAEMLTWPYRERRAALESLFQGHGLEAPWALSPSTTDRDEAQRWLRKWAAVGVEGLVAKGLGQAYEPGRRGWQKYRSRHTAEAVVGAVTGTLKRPESVLLGRYDAGGELRLVARSTPLPAALRSELGGLFTAAGPDHPWRGVRISSHWGSREPLDFTPVAPQVVAEFYGDTAVDRGRWRHPVRLHRVRTDMTPDDLPLHGPQRTGRPAAEPTAAPAEGRTTRRHPRGQPMAEKAPERTVYHITPRQGTAGGAWQVEHMEGRRSVREPHPTQRQAVDAARRQALQHQPAQVVVHGRDGRVRTEYTFGDGPGRAPGQA
ncbi:DUF2188 domain-containing protein [Streptomyces sp. NPDC015127]|uniref:ATP-dependent DNA ligase n=1 Tax=Streptomyces sp. NPDC015127 TaxID=3364939 RepID=UPI00370228CC